MSLRRIGRLFTPYRWQLVIVTTIIAASSIVGLASPFLLRAVIDTALPDKNVRLLAWLVAGMVAVAAVTSAFGVIQTWIATKVGQQVMHGLRTSVFGHLQRQSVAFFTRTRTGEVQSRITNDIGGMESVVTSTATSIAANFTTAIATAAAMIVLSWQLSLISLVVMPPSIYLTRKVARMRRAITTEQQRELADLNVTIEEGLSINGVQLAKTMGTGPSLVQRFTASSARLIDLELRSQLAGRWRMASLSIMFAAIPAIIYLAAGLPLTAGVMTIGTLIAFTTLQNSLFRPLTGLLGTSVSVISSLALFARIFEYLDLPVDVDDPADPVEIDPARVAGHVSLTGVSFSYPGADRPALAGVDLDVPACRTLALVGETGSGKTTLAALIARLYDPASGTVRIDGTDIRDMRLADLAAIVGVVSQETYLLHTTVRENLRYASARAPPTRKSRTPPAPPRSTTSSPGCRMATTPWSAPAGIVSPAARSSASPSPGPCCGTRACSFLTRPPARWTPRPSAPCRRRSTPWPGAAPPSPSRTGCPPCATPIRSSCWIMAASSRPAPTPASSPIRAATRSWPRRPAGWPAEARPPGLDRGLAAARPAGGFCAAGGRNMKKRELTRAVLVNPESSRTGSTESLPSGR